MASLRTDYRNLLGWQGVSLHPAQLHATLRVLASDALYLLSALSVLLIALSAAIIIQLRTLDQSIVLTNDTLGFQLELIRSDVQRALVALNSLDAATQTISLDLQEVSNQIDDLPDVLAERIYEGEESWGTSIKGRLEETVTALDIVSETLESLQTIVDAFETVVGVTQNGILTEQTALLTQIAEALAPTLASRVLAIISETPWDINMPEASTVNGQIVGLEFAGLECIECAGGTVGLPFECSGCAIELIEFELMEAEETNAPGSELFPV